MTVHPQIAEVLRSLPAPPPGPIDPTVLRTVEEQGLPALEDRIPMLAVEDMVASTPTGEVPVRLTRRLEAESYGLLVYFHGGALLLGSLETHDQIARSLAKESGFRVISVGFRRAPEHAFPAG